MKRLALLLALALCLCACGPAPAAPLPAETTLPTQTTAPPETNQPSETTASPAITDFTPYEAMISYDAEPNWLALAMDLTFEKPEDVSLYYLFYPGVNYPGTWNDVSAESRQTLISHGFSTDFDLQIMPVWLLEEALQTTFGIGLEDVTIPEEWCYIDAEDAWCSNHEEQEIPGIPEITAVEDDGEMIVIYYTTHHLYPGSDIGWGIDQVMTLHRNDDATIHAISNRLDK